MSAYPRIFGFQPAMLGHVVEVWYGDKMVTWGIAEYASGSYVGVREFTGRCDEWPGAAVCADPT